MKTISLLIAVLTAFSMDLMAQDGIARVTDNIFIKDVRITVRPGVHLERASILIKDGIIDQVGTDLSAPADAEIVSGDSLHLYAGFIAPLSQAGIPKPKEDGARPKVKRTGYPPNDVAGITPEIEAGDVYDASEGKISALRKAGFGIAHIVPQGRMMPGQGAVVSLNGKAFNEAAITRRASLYGSLTGTRGVFPATTIGVMSKWREMYKNGEMALAHEEVYLANPRNKKRPDYDAALGALFPVIRGTTPVFFKANKHVDVHRVIQLKKELGFNLVLAEVEQGNMALDAIGQNATMSLLSLDLPDAIKEEKEKKDEDKKEEPEESAEVQHLKKRKAESVAEYEKQAAEFAAAELPFAFSYLDVKPKDIMANVRRMIKAGLSQEDALAGLTISAAEALKISAIAGTVEKGKIGNLVLTTKPLFEEDSKIKIVFVDGVKYEMDIKEKKAKKDGADVVVDLVGVWDYEIEIPGMTPKGTMTFTKEDDVYNIELTNDQSPGEIIKVSDVELDGGTMSFEYNVDAGGNTINVMTEIEFDGNSFEGDVSVADFGSFPVKGDKKDNPE